MRSSRRIFGIALSIVIIAEVIVRVLPTYYMEDARTFFIDHLREKIDQGKIQADILVMGDSSTMAIEGYKPGKSGDFSVYNVSVPEMGPRYYLPFLRKYLASANKKPKMILIGGKIQTWTTGYGTPLYDSNSVPLSITSDFWNFEYLDKEIARRSDKSFFKERKDSGTQKRDELYWEYFGARYLHQFSFSDFIQYFGQVDRVFLVYKSLPLLFKTFQYRDAVKNAFYLGNWETWDAKKQESWIQKCEECSNKEAGICAPPDSHLQDNLLVALQTKMHQGKYNLATRLTPIQVLQYKAITDKTIESTVGFALKDKTINTSPIEDLRDFDEQNGLLIGYIRIPMREEYRSPIIEKRFSVLKKLLDQSTNGFYFSVEEKYYPGSSFIDNVHYSCRAERKMNREIYEKIYPNIVRGIQSSLSN